MQTSIYIHTLRTTYLLKGAPPQGTVIIFLYPFTCFELKLLPQVQKDNEVYHTIFRFLQLLFSKVCLGKRYYLGKGVGQAEFLFFPEINRKTNIDSESFSGH